MGMQTDVMAKSVTTSSTVYDGRARLRGVVVIPGSANGSIEFKDGGASGTSIMLIPTIANGEPFNVLIPAEGVLFESNVYLALSGANTAATVFYA